MNKEKTNNKVTMRTLIASQIVPAIFLVVYYWMWARVYHWDEFQSNYYALIQNVLFIFAGVFYGLLAYAERKYKKEKPDELATHNLLRVNSISFKFLIIILILASFVTVIFNLPGWGLGYIVVGAILLVTVVRASMFWIMDVKGV